MNKKIKKITVAMMTIGCLTVGSLGVMAYAAGNPYENFKEAVVETMKADNMTVTASVQLKQNGAEIAEGNTLLQKAGTDNYSLSNITIGGKVIETEQSDKGGVIISRQGDKYFTTNINRGDKMQHNIKESPNMTKLMEMVADLLIGDVKNQFVSKGDTITVSLTDAQIPELANVAMSAFTEMSGKYGSDKYSHNKNENFSAGMANVFPITQDSKIKSVKVNASIKDRGIKDMDMNIVMTGQDKDGKTVSMEITVNGTVSKLGTTTPQQIDTTGKTVTERNFGGRHSR